MKKFGRGIASVAVVAMAGLAGITPQHSARAASPEAPKFEVDASWPKPTPNNWIYGQIGGIFVDKDDNLWIAQRPRTVSDRDKRAELKHDSICCKLAPPVIEINKAGEVIRSWGGDSKVPAGQPGHYDWPSNEHGMFMDYKGNIWIAGNGMNDGMALKFTADGKFLLQIGKSAPMTNSKDTTQLGRTADMVVDPATNEVYFADGYFNHRVIVFDADTGAFKRMWGAYGKPPTDDKITYDPKVLPQQFANPVHGIRITNDGLVVVSDRANNRIQVFQKDGTFVKEYLELRDSTAPGVTGSVMFWPDKAQDYWFTSDDPNGQIHVIRRSDGAIVGSFGHVGRDAGGFENLHNIAIDSKGNIYSAEVQGQRVQKWVYKGGLPPLN